MIDCVSRLCVHLPLFLQVCLVGANNYRVFGMRSSQGRGSPRPVASSSPSHTSAPLVPALGTQPPFLHPRQTAGHLLDGRPQRLPHSRHRVHDSMEVSGWEEMITLLLLWWTTDQLRMALVLDHVVLIISVSKNYMKIVINSKLYETGEVSLAAHPNPILAWFSVFVCSSFLTHGRDHSWLEAHSNKSR